MDIWKIKEQIRFLNTKADLYHIDVFDGHYVKNFCFSPDFVAGLRPHTQLPLDIHLCISAPQDFVDTFIKSGSDYISVHADVVYKDAFRQIESIKNRGAKVGIVLNPAVPLKLVQPYIGLVDKLTIMTIDIGFAGQRLIPCTLDKIREAVHVRQKGGYSYLIEADGQCNKENFKSLIEAGVDIMIVGRSGLFLLHDSIEKAWDIMTGNIFDAKTVPDFQE
jgi:D-allulose-6-phosphate 3-epimerase